MRGAAVERVGGESRGEPQHPRDRVLGPMGIGDVALPAVDRQLARERAAPSDLDHLAQGARVRRLAEQAMVEPLAPRLRPGEELDRAVDRRSLLVAGDQEGDRAGKSRTARVEKSQRRGEHAGDAALHVHGAAPIEHAVGDGTGERPTAPGGGIARRHHVGMAGKQQAWATRADPGVEILDVGRPVSGENRTGDGKSRLGEHPVDQGEGATLLGSDGGAAQERLREGERADVAGHAGLSSIRCMASSETARPSSSTLIEQPRLGMHETG